jgi:hypothetical protein
MRGAVRRAEEHSNGFRIQILLLDQRKWRKPKVWLKLKAQRRKKKKRRDEQNRR